MLPAIKVESVRPSPDIRAISKHFRYYELYVGAGAVTTRPLQNYS